MKKYISNSVLNNIQLTKMNCRFIHFNELRPCFYDDPLQIFMRKRLGFIPTVCNYISNASKAMKEFYFKYAKELSIEEEKDFCQEQGAYYHSKLYDDKNKVISTADFIFSKDVIQKYFNVEINPVNPLICVFFVSSPLSPYQKYKIVAVSQAIRNSVNIDSTKMVLFYPSTSKSEIVDMKSFSYLESRYKSYIEWYNNISKLPENVSVEDHPYLYPNMKYMDELNDDAVKWKTDWAFQCEEITLLPGIYPSHRQICKNIKELSKDPMFFLDKMKIRGSKTSILKMVEMRYGSSSLWIGNQDELKQECLDWKRRYSYLFIDFETIENNIYMIGIGHYNEKDGFEYKCLVSKSNSTQDIQELLTRFYVFLKEFPFSIDRIFYWYAETIFLQQASQKYDISNLLSGYNWVDLCSIFRRNPVIIKNCFNYKLKNIWRCMKDLGMIDTPSPPKECCNGEQSIDIAKHYFLTKCPETFDILQKYNEFDCKVMYDILSYLNKRFL